MLLQIIVKGARNMNDLEALVPYFTQKPGTVLAELHFARRPKVAAAGLCLSAPWSNKHVATFTVPSAPSCKVTAPLGNLILFISALSCVHLV